MKKLLSFCAAILVFGSMMTANAAYYLVGDLAANGWDHTKATLVPAEGLTINKAAGTYSFRFLSQQGVWDQNMGYKQLNKSCSSSGVEAGNNDNNIKVTLPVAGDVTVKIENSKVCVTGTFGELVITNYTIAGDSAMMGENWNEKSTANEMTYDPVNQEWTLTKSRVTLAAGKYEYKVVGNHDWQAFSYPSANEELIIDEPDVYDIVFTWSDATETLNAEAEVATALVNQSVKAQATKAMVDGKLVILKGDKSFNVLGVQL